MSKQCKNCGDVYTDDMWKKRKNRYGSYVCPSCSTKSHWSDLKNVNRSDLK